VSPTISTIIGWLPPAGQIVHLPVFSTQTGNIFDDRYDRNLRWYLPTFTLLTPDPAFSFAAAQTGVDAAGNPFNQAVLTLSLQEEDPDDVQRARAANPSLEFRQIPALSVTATLQVHYKDTTGADATAAFAAQLTPQGNAQLLTANGLLGPAVIQAYENLTTLGQAAVVLQLKYTVWLHPYQLPGPVWPPRQEIWYTFIATTTVMLPLGLTYATDPYRARYTITPAGGNAHPIINVDDLLGFDVEQSEYRELTTLGDVRQSYPSLDRLYYGQVSGTVIAIPARYGIICSSNGCAARLDAVVDPAALNGCRFHFTFTLAPVADPIDFAHLVRDLATTPEARNRTLTLRLPDGLDSRMPGNLSGFAVASAAYANGPGDGTLLLAVDITDTGTTPAVVNANLFLTQLTTPGPTLFGQIGARLDDLYTPIVQTSVILNFSTTSGTDDISITLAEDPPQVTAVNRAPFDLHLTAFANITASMITQIDIDETLPSTESFGLPGGDPAAEAVVVRRSIPVAEPFPKPKLFQYLDVHTQDVQTIQHPLIVNATPVNFDTAQIAQVTIQFTLSDLPTIPVNSLTLTPAHRVDQVTVVIPMTVAVAGLSTILTATVTGTNRSQRQVEFTNDFIANPIYVISTL
jgi:hypothetical protein